MKRYILLDKKIGETPLSALQKWKRLHGYDKPACYAGRLDPMASGKLLVLLGDACKEQAAYRNLDKEYDIEILVGIGTDTGDVLGIPHRALHQTRINNKLLANIFTQECGGHIQAYPAFSSKTVNGKPLFMHALEGTLGDISLPTHIEHIYRIRYQGSYSVSHIELAQKVSALLDHVPRTDEPSKKLGKDFRVDTIREDWAALLSREYRSEFTILRLKVTCASGTYMRSLATRVGRAIGTEAFAFSIRRTNIGKYIQLFSVVGFWLPIPYLAAYHRYGFFK
jgi:tRNA pseudouridine55 synthase